MNRAHAVLITVLACGLALGVAFAGGTVAAETPQDVSAGEEHTLHTAVASAGDSPQQSALAMAQIDCEYPIEVTDATGETVTVEEEPAEVVVLGASDAQQLWALGVEEKVTGMPIFSATEYLDDRDERTNVVGEFGFPVVEEVVGLEPDLVLAASATPEEDVESIRDAGVTIHYAPSESTLEDVYSGIERTGQLVGACDEADALVDEMQATISAIEEAVADEEPVSVYYAMGGGWTAGDRTVEDHMIRVAGGENIAHAADIAFYDEISEEVVVAQDPDWLVLSEGAEIPEEATGTTAVEQDQIVRVDSDAISQPGPRMVEPVEAMAEAFHPEAIAEIDEESGADDEMGDDTADETDSADDTDAMDDTADDDGAGLTVVAAVLALTALVLSARQQV